MLVSDVVTILSLGGGLATGIAALIIAWSTKKKVKAETKNLQADAAEKIAEAAGNMVSMHREEFLRLTKKIREMEGDVSGCHDKLDRLEERVEELKEENIKLKSMVELLHSQVKQMGINPLVDPYWRDNR
jgi:predicted nuclease with TOPRIM domain